jgi:hypothetical protein
MSEPAKSFCEQGRPPNTGGIHLSRCLMTSGTLRRGICPGGRRHDIQRLLLQYECCLIAVRFRGDREDIQKATPGVGVASSDPDDVVAAVDSMVHAILSQTDHARVK